MAIFGFFQGAKKIQLFKNHKIALTYLYGLTMKNEGNLFYPTLKVGVKSYLPFYLEAISKSYWCFLVSQAQKNQK